MEALLAHQREVNRVLANYFCPALLRNRTLIFTSGIDTFALKTFLSKDNYAEEARRLGISARLASAQKTSEAVRSTDYVQRLRGTIGAQPW